MRTVLAVSAGALVVAFLTSLSAGAAPPRLSSSQLYLVQPDPRLCPSPRCGGYWVAQANRATTRCADGRPRPRCYVAVAVGESREPLAAPIPEGALVRGALAIWSEEPGRLGVLIAAIIRAPFGERGTAPVYRVRDTGIRCVKAPCFFMRARRVSAPSVVSVSELALDAAGLSPGQLVQAQRALGSKAGLFLAGRIERASDGGRRMSVIRVYLSP